MKVHPPRTRENGFTLCTRCEGNGCISLPNQARICPECNGLGWFEHRSPVALLWGSIPSRKVIVAWSLLYWLHVAYAWQGRIIRKLEEWIDG